METSQVEWKREFTEDIKKELVAFANTQGGELLVGIANDGSVQCEGKSRDKKTILYSKKGNDFSRCICQAGKHIRV